MKTENFIQDRAQAPNMEESRVELKLARSRILTFQSRWSRFQAAPGMASRGNKCLPLRTRASPQPGQCIKLLHAAPTDRGSGIGQADGPPLSTAGATGRQQAAGPHWLGGYRGAAAGTAPKRDSSQGLTEG